jgi:hypothetical protein
MRGEAGNGSPWTMVDIRAGHMVEISSVVRISKGLAGELV